MNDQFMQVAVNGRAHEIPPATHIAGLIELLQVQGRLAVELNGAVVPRSAHATTVLKVGDRIEIVRAIGGG